jgi:hypothetical protein
MNDIKIIIIGVCMIISYIQIFIWLKRKENPLTRATLTLILGSLLLFLIPQSEILISTYFFCSRIYRFFKRRKVKKDKAIPLRIERSNPEHIYLESDKGTIDIANPYRGILIQGGAGSGKSKSLFYPIIQQFITNDFSGVLYDFKSPELSQLAYSFHTKNNKVQFALLNFKDITTSIRVNPLSPEYLTKQAIAFEMATVLVNNLLPESIKKKDYWIRSSISVIAGTIWYLRNNYPQLCTLPHMIALILSFPSTLLIEKLSKDIETAGMIASLKEAHEMNAEKQIAGVVGTIKNALAQLNIPEIFYLLSEENTSLDVNNPENPVFLSIGNDSSLSNTYAPIISLIISVCARQMNQPDKHQSTIILDEAPTLYIPDFEQIPATARSNRVATVVGAQDYSQMVDKYGSDKAQVMISNLGNQFYGRTVNEKTADMIVKLFGKHDVTFNTISNSSGSSSGGLLSDHYSSSNNKSVSQSIQQRERVNISNITNMPPGTFYGFIADGNIRELVGSRLQQIESSYRKFEKTNISIDPKETFRKIYNDLSLIQDKAISDTDFKIELT